MVRAIGARDRFSWLPGRAGCFFDSRLLDIDLYRGGAFQDRVLLVSHLTLEGMCTTISLADGYNGAATVANYRAAIHQ